MQTGDDQAVTLVGFSEIVREEFQTLTNRYALDFCGCEHVDQSDPEASAYEVRFRNAVAGVTVSYLTSGADVNVILSGSVDCVKSPAAMSIYDDRGHPRAVLLDALVHYSTNGTASPPLPMITVDLALEEMFRRHDEREQLIATRLRHVLRSYAEFTDKYAARILQGDFSLVPEIQRYTTKLYYPSPEEPPNEVT